MKNVTFIFLVCFFFISCGNSQEVKTITTLELKTLLAKENIQLLDVRTPKEIKEGFIESAVFANFYNEDFIEKAIKQLDKKEPVYLYCRSGGRSGKASKILQEKGFKVYNVTGGYSQWNQENLKK